MDTAELLRSFVRDRSENAFNKLVAMHIDLVYSAAFRQVRHAAMADDVTQAVFITLARKAAELKPNVPLQAWLLKVTHYTALTTRRSQERRWRHEQEAAMNNPVSHSPSTHEFAGIAEHLDQALAELRETDRNLIALRFMQSLSLKQVALAVGINENTAGKRISRVLEKLRGRLARRGVAAPAATIAALLGTHAIGRAPAALAGTVAHAAIAAQPWLSSSVGGGAVLTGLETKAAILLAAVMLFTGIALWHTVAGRSSVTPKVASPIPATASLPLPTTPAIVQIALPQAIYSKAATLPQATYFPDPAQNLFPAGILKSTERPSGWQDLSGWDTGNATIVAGVRIVGDKHPLYWNFTNVDLAKTVAVRALVSLKPDTKKLAVMFPLGGENLVIGESPNAGAGVGFAFLDKDAKQTGSGMLVTTIQTGFKLRIATLNVPANAVTLLISFQMANITGGMIVGNIVVSPVDQAKEPDPTQVVSLHNAVSRGYVQTVKSMIATDKRLLECRNLDYNGGTPLIGAAWKGQAEVASLLIDMGADVNALDGNAFWRDPAWSATYWAAYWGHPNVLSILMARTKNDPQDVLPYALAGQKAHVQNGLGEDYPACIDLLNSLPTTRPATTNPSTSPGPAGLLQRLWGGN